LELLSSKMLLLPTFVGRVSFYLTRKMPINMGNLIVLLVTFLGRIIRCSLMYKILHLSKIVFF